ncbi:calcium-binding protein [Streptomyces sp. NPDC049906]|uniref:calcium-binding protein n=1 Tax=Streptomyces sp. NPDC049906 TaxID=3155656 RepID=UPI00344AE65D
MRASAALTSGALALTGLAVPAAHAAPAEPIVLSNFSVNGGKGIHIGSLGSSFTITFSASHPANVERNSVLVLRQGSGELIQPYEVQGNMCKAVSDTRSDCTATFRVETLNYDIKNRNAGDWRTWLRMKSTDHSSALESDNVKTVKILRAAKLTANASPEPVRRGATITVTGDLTRADWDAFADQGYAAQPVKLQYKKNGSSTWTTLKTVKTDRYGKLKTTVKATADGSYRYGFAGTSTTAAVNSSADHVDVR